jgi:flagellar hook-basal body complex protein FliE
MGGNTISGGMFIPPVTPTTPLSTPGVEEGQNGFGSVLRDAVDRVEELHGNAEMQASGLVQGERSDVQNVMIAVEKADVAFQLMMQVRNKIVNAYEEISKLQF